MNKLFGVLLLPLLMAAHVYSQENDPFGALSRLDQALSVAEEEFTPQDGYYIGRAVAANILDHYKLYTGKPSLTRYLNLICGALTVNSSSPEWYNGYHVMMLDSDVPNAFSTPAGHIFLSRGLITMAMSEDVLAAAIAHEIAHIQLRHGITEIEHQRLVQDLGREQQRISRMTERELAAEQQRLFAVPVNEIVTVLFAKGYSQIQETEADTLALSLLASAGYDPRGLVELLKLIAAYHPSDNDGSLTNSHPLPAKRIADAERLAAGYRVRDTRSYRKERFINYFRH